MVKEEAIHWSYSFIGAAYVITRPLEGDIPPTYGYIWLIRATAFVWLNGELYYGVSRFVKNIKIRL